LFVSPSIHPDRLPSWPLHRLAPIRLSLSLCLSNTHTSEEMELLGTVDPVDDPRQRRRKRKGRRERVLRENQSLYSWILLLQIPNNPKITAGSSFDRVVCRFASVFLMQWRRNNMVGFGFAQMAAKNVTTGMFCLQGMCWSLKWRYFWRKRLKRYLLRKRLKIRC